MKTKSYSKLLLAFCTLAALIVPLALTPGCASRSKVSVSQGSSVGQQLQDLDKSYKDGIISQKEYERLKKAIISNND